MRRALALAAFAALILTGCAAKITPIGSSDVSRLHSDLRTCARENIAFALIPDFGITADNHRLKCLKQRGWVMGGYNEWAWIGDGVWTPISTMTMPSRQPIESLQTPEPTWATGF
jgi:hypothetical protein